MQRLLIVGGSESHTGGSEHFIRRSSEALRRRGGWKVETMPTNSAYLSASTIKPYLSSLVSLLRRSKGFDHLWVQYGSFPDLAFVVLARLTGCDVIVTPHLGTNWRSQSSPILRYISQWAIGFADRVAIFSETQQAELGLSNLPITRIRTFLPEESLDPVQAEQPTGATKRLVHAARLSEEKGSFLMIDVCARLKQANVPFSAEIIGGADEVTLERLQRKIQESGLGGEVSLHGHMPVPDLLRRVRSADFLVHLSKMDSYPLVVLEALTCSTLPICLDLPGARHMIETYDGYVVDSSRSAEAAAAIIIDLNVKEARARAEKAASRVIADYNWSSAGELLEKALETTQLAVGTNRAR